MIPIKYLFLSQVRQLKHFLPVLFLLMGVSVFAQQPNLITCTTKTGKLGDLKVCVNKDSAFIEAKQTEASVVPAGFARTYLLSKGSEQRVIAKNASPLFKVKAQGFYGIHTLVYDPAKLNPDTLFPPKNYKVTQLAKRFLVSTALQCAGVDTTGAQFAFNECDTCGTFAGALRVLAQNCLDNGTARLQAVEVTTPTFPSKYKVIYVLTSGNDLIIEAFSATPDFIVRKTGVFTIHTLVYDPAKINLGEFDPGEFNAGDILKKLVQGGGKICGALDVPGAKFNVSICPCAANPGALVAASQPCINKGSVQLTANRVLPTVIPTGFQLRYVLTKGEDLTIVQLGQNPQFSVAQTGRYRIHSFVYNPATLDLSGVIFGTTKAAAINAKLVQGGGVICGALDLFGATFDVTSCPCEPTAGSLRPDAQVCYDNINAAKLTAVIVNAPVIPTGYLRRYVLTSGANLVIENVSQNPVFNVTKTGNYRIHTLIYNPADLDLSTVIFGITRAADINKLLIQGGGELCGALDLTGALFEVTSCPCTAKAGTLVAIDQPCLNAGSARIRGNIGTASVVPTGFKLVYILTQGDVLVVRQVKEVADFTVTAAGRYRVHAFVYNPSTFNINDIQTGVTTAQAVRDRLIEGGGSICGSIQLTGLVFDVSTCAPTCTASAGTLKVLDQTCLPVGGTARLRATSLLAPSVPEGFLLRYVLTSGDNLVIQNVASSADFNVASTGRFRIHTLVYDPTTLNLTGVIFGSTRASAIASQLIQGGGSVCGALDVTGAIFDVVNCVSCTAYSGTLIPANAPCLDNWWDARLRAATNKAPVIPTGYQLRYLVTNGNNLVITQIGDKPDFTVHTTGTWRIHALVYNPSTFNLSQIVLNTTTIEDLKLYLVRGIVATCASLDETGAYFFVKPCEGCNVEAGTMKPKIQVCLNAQTGARLQADVDRAPIVPTGYLVKYVLSYGDNMTVLLVGNTPDFTVGNTGRYRIHTLVYNPNSFNPATAFQLGVTMLKTVKQTFIQDGGTLCAAVDPVGAYFEVSTCQQTCGVSAGTLNPVGQPCLDNWKDTRLQATVGTQPSIPSGYVIRYLLTSGDSKVIEKVSSVPDFVISKTGKYRIHTLVYNPNTLNFTIYLGKTLLNELNVLFIQGGGAVCGALDLTGAYFNVEACLTCTVSTGKLKAKVPDCFKAGSIIKLSTEVLIAPIVPTGYTICYAILNTAGTIIDVTETPTANVYAAGTYCMHAFVFPNAQFSVGRIVKGSTSLSQLNLWLKDLCSAIDLTGICFNVNTCAQLCEVKVGKLVPRTPNCFTAGGIVTLVADVTVAPVIPSGFTINYAITNANGVIVDVTEQPSVVVRNSGTYCMHAFIYPTASFNVGRIIENSTTVAQLAVWLKEYCSSIDLTGVCFPVTNCTTNCNVDAGILYAPTVSCLVDSFKVCLNVKTAPNTPGGFTVCYALVDDKGVIVDVVEDRCFWLKKTGNYCAHVFVFRALTFNPNNIIKGVTTLKTLNTWLSTGNFCADLDEVGACFTVKECLPTCEAAPGTLVSDLEECFAYDYAWIGAKHPSNSKPVIPNGYNVTYLLVSADNVVRQVGVQPKFGLLQTGNFRILTLVYNPSTLPLNSIVVNTTTLAQINAKLIQGGGKICGALDLNGASFKITLCACTADAGKLKSTDEFCLPKNGELEIKATTLTSSIIPAGYAVRYLLSKGDSKVILDLNTTPSFGVTETGTYRIHTLVFNSASFQLNSIKFGTTTIAGLRAQFIEGGGTICASVEPTGAQIVVDKCQEPCLANPGQLSAIDDPCLRNGQGIFNAKFTTNPVIPAGFQVRYILTFTDNLIVKAISTTPSFIVTQVGRYRIHTLVYFPGDINFNNVVFGTTTLTYFKDQVNKTGICVKMDAEGLLNEFTPCQNTCVAFAGTYKRLGDSCIASLPARFRTTVVTPAVVPVNYQVRYLLAKGDTKVIEQISSAADFTVNSTNDFIIYTFVYDPNTFAINSIQLGTSTITGLKAQLANRDLICSSIDEGVPFKAGNCCAGSLGMYRPFVNVPCVPEGGCAYVKFSWIKKPVVPAGWKIRYYVSAPNSKILDEYFDKPEFLICRIGKYTVHQLIYNPKDFDPSKLFRLGQATTDDIAAELQDYPCAHFDKTGYLLHIQLCNCPVWSGNLEPELMECFKPGGITIKAKITMGSMFDAPFKEVFVLTSGDSLNILAVSSSPSFHVTQVGTYQIQSVIVKPGEVSVGDFPNLYRLMRQLKLGGGEYCGLIELSGATFKVNDCKGFSSGSPANPSTDAYPNPTNGQVRLVFSNPKLVDATGISVEVLDLNGSVINRSKFDEGSTEGQLDLKSLPSGLYLIRVMRSGQAPELIRINKM